MSLLKKIEEIGLSPNEARVYLAGLELGETSVQRIAKKTNIKRTTVYRVIESLRSKGLFAAVVNRGRKNYAAEEPQKLSENLKHQQMILDETMPHLLSLMRLFDKKPEIKFFEGEKGLKSIYEDTLQYKNSEILAWVNSDAIANFQIDFLRKYYLSERLKRRIKVRAIATDNEEMRRYKSRDISSLRQTQLIGSKDSNFNTEISIYGKDKVSIIDFKEKIGLVIRSAQIFETFRKIFETFWELLAKK